MFDNTTISLNALSNVCARIAWFWGWMKGEVYKIKVDTTDRPPACILDDAACINIGEDQLR
jgi:hypothetical protein